MPTCAIPAASDQSQAVLVQLGPTGLRLVGKRRESPTSSKTTLLRPLEVCSEKVHVCDWKMHISSSSNTCVCNYKLIIPSKGCSVALGCIPQIQTQPKRLLHWANHRARAQVYGKLNGRGFTFYWFYRARYLDSVDDTRSLKLKKNGAIYCRTCILRGSLLGILCRTRCDMATACYRRTGWQRTSVPTLAENTSTGIYWTRPSYTRPEHQPIPSHWCGSTLGKPYYCCTAVVQQYRIMRRSQLLTVYYSQTPTTDSY